MQIIFRIANYASLLAISVFSNFGLRVQASESTSVTAVLEASSDGTVWSLIDPGIHAFSTPKVFIRNTLTKTGSNEEPSAEALVSITFPSGSGDALVALDSSLELQTWAPASPGVFSSPLKRFFRLAVTPLLAAPGDLTAQTLSPLSIQLDWEDNSDYESGFRVDRRILGGVFSDIATLPENSTIYTDSGLDANTAYQYRVLTFNDGSESDYSDIAGSTTGTPTVSTWEETFDDLTNGTTEDTGDTAWTASATLSSGGTFSVLDGAFDSAKVMPGTWLSQIIPISGNATITVVHVGHPDMESNDSISVSTIVDGGEQVAFVNNLTGNYSERIDSTDVTGSTVQVRIDTFSTGSTEHHRIDRVTVLGATGGSLPAMATNLVASADEAASIQLTWTDNSANETGFIISRSESGGDFVEIITVGQDVTSYSDTGLPPSTNYEYMIAAVNADGVSPQSNVASSRTWSTTTPLPPTQLAASADQANVILNWSDNSLEEMGYRIFRQASDETDYSLIATLAANTVRYTDTDLQLDSQYAYQVVAYNGHGESAVAGPVFATTEPAATPSSEVVSLWPLTNASFELSTSLGGWLEDDEDGLITLTSSSDPVPPSGFRLLRITGPGGKIEQAIYKPIAGHRYEVKAWVYNHGTVGIQDLGSDTVFEIATNHGASWKQVKFTYVSTGSPSLIYAKYGPGVGISLFDDFEANDISSVEDLALPPPSNIMRYPSQVLDLSWWKINLPINNAEQHYTPELYKFVSEPWFKLVEDEDGYAVQFRANHGGSTTSGSSNPRSELREMTQNYSRRNASSGAAWSNTDGKTHTMWIKQKVTHLTTVKPHVVVGQIHDAADDVAVFRLEGLGGGPSGNGGTVGVMDTHAKLWITYGDDTHEYLVDPSYELGTVFTVKFIAHDGVIEFEYNEERLPYVHTQDVAGCYFKLGNYTQSHKGTAPSELDSAYAETYVYDYYITHE